MATHQEADLQEALAVGSERPDLCWILTDRDVWHRNPFYKGQPEPHPDEEEGLGIDLYQDDIEF